VTFERDVHKPNPAIKEEECATKIARVTGTNEEWGETLGSQKVT